MGLGSAAIEAFATALRAEPTEITPGDRVVARVLLATSILATLTMLALSTTMTGPVRAAVFAAGFVTLGAVLARGRWRATLQMRTVLTLSIVLTLVAVAIPPRESRDVWSYAFYGRIISEYGENPYAATPDDFPDDPYYDRVGVSWRGDTSLYGPVFVGLSAGVMTIAGANHQVARLLFQAVMAAAALAVLLLVARHTRSSAAVAFVGLSPLMLYTVINGAHNDILVSLALLGAALATTRGRDQWAAVLVAGAILMKLVAILALPALVFWVWHRRGPLRAAMVGAIAATLVALGSLAAGGLDTLRTVAGESDRLSRGSIWQLVRPGGWGRLFSWAEQSARPITSEMGGVAIVVMGALALWFTYTRRRDVTPELAFAAGVAAFLLAAPYALPWYAAMVLPLLALRWRSGLAVLIGVQSSVWAVAYQYERGPPLSGPNRVLWLGAAATVALNLAIIVALVVWGYHRERDARRAERALPVVAADGGTAP